MTEPTIVQEAAKILEENGGDPTDQWAHYWAIDKAMGRRGLLKMGNRPAEPKMEEEEEENEQITET